MRISDWSSDVCSSDLFGGMLPEAFQHGLGLQAFIVGGEQLVEDIADGIDRRGSGGAQQLVDDHRAPSLWNVVVEGMLADHPAEIGRASGRERVCQYG